MERRELFQILAYTAAAPASAQHESHVSRFDPRSQKPRFFTAAEYELLDHFAEALLPGDAESGGAREAGVRYYIDTILFYGDAASREAWRNGLARMQAVAKDVSGASFPDLAESDRNRVMSALFGVPDAFALRFKALVVEAYSLSEAGMKHFGYRGNRAVYEFPGCTHADHKKA